MAFCINCGQELVEGAKFCYNCGAKNEVTKNESSERKTVFDGEIHKCPNCGDTIDAFETICETCGYEIRGRKTLSVVHELFLKLEQTQDSKKKDELIRNFYIPNTKEDIYDFFILATSNIKVGGDNTNAWMVKLEQAYQKAELSLGNTSEFQKFKLLYEKTQAINRKNIIQKVLVTVFKCFKSGYAWAALGATVGALMLAISGDVESEPSASQLTGFLLLVGSAWIAILTMVNRDDKKKK